MSRRVAFNFLDVALRSVFIFMHVLVICVL